MPVWSYDIEETFIRLFKVFYLSNFSTATVILRNMFQIDTMAVLSDDILLLEPAAYM